MAGKRRRVAALRRSAAKAQVEVVVVAKCVTCGTHRDIRAGEIPRGETPMCECGSPMAAKKATVRRKRAAVAHAR
jgi:hypothetical protein